MSEAGGFNPENPVRRGRRDPELALRMDQELGEAGQEGTGELGLAIGEQVLYKVTVMDPNLETGNDRWFTYGVTTTVQSDENEVDTFQRVITLVHGRLIEAIENKNELDQQAAVERRNRPIVPR